jgi:hypothetical protein
MVPASPSRRLALVAGLVVLLFVAGVTHPSINDVPGFSDHTGPTEMDVTGFERLGAGCADDVATYARSGTGPNGTYERITFVETGDPDANLSVSAVRTSPRGADLSTFRVAVDSHTDAPPNETCRMGVQYRVELESSGGSPPGFMPDAHGTRILWLENGEYAGCSSSSTGTLDTECHRFLGDHPDRTWANATT